MYELLCFSLSCGIFLAKMLNRFSKFHHFSFQSSKFAFCHFNSLSFNPPQFSSLLKFHPFLLLIKNIIFIIYFLILKKVN